MLLIRKICLIILMLVFCSSASFALDTKAKYVAIMDYDTGDLIYTKNHQEMVPPASMSKIMTVYILLDKVKKGDLSLEDEFVVSENAWRKGGAATGGSTMFLNIKEKVKVEDLLKGMIIQSGNDACIVVAENLAGSEESFSIEMNAVAEELGLKNFNFLNSTGLPQDGHRISMEDLAILSRRLIKDFPEFYHLFSEKEFTHNSIKQGNRNPLLYNMDGADGIKTGHTKEAGFCLATSVKKKDRRLIGVMGGMDSIKERSEESQKLMGWAFREFDNYKIISKGKAVKEVKVFMGKDESKVSLIAKEEFFATLSRTDYRNMTAKVEYISVIKAPVVKGREYGKLIITIPERKDITIPLVAEKNIEKKSFFSKIVSNIQYLLFGVM